jgi:GNAT superfamily N-acetyltransferase
MARPGVSGSITVRDATAGDLHTMVRLLGELHDPPTAAANPRVWTAILAEPGRTVLIAEVDGAPVGTADLSIAPNLTHHARPFALIENLSVASAHRRSGVGRALMSEIERRARAADCYKIQLLSATRRTDAHTFYGSLGYARAAEGFRRYL